MNVKSSKDFVYLGVKLPSEAQLHIALTRIYGIGRSIARAICTECDLSFYKKMKDLEQEEWDKIKTCLDSIEDLEGNLRRKVSGYIRKLAKNGSRRGARIQKGLPNRGQRTRTNGKTSKRRRSRKLISSEKKKSA